MDLLSTYLSDRDTPCPGCGYNLRGLTGSKCPECNRDLELSIGSVEPRMGLYLAALIGAAAGLGFSGPFLLLVFFTWLNSPWGGPPLAVWLYLVPITSLHGGLVFALVKFGGRVRRWRHRRRLLLMLGAWGLALLNLVVFAALSM